MKTPALGRVVAFFAMVRFCRMLGTLLGSGVPLVAGLRVAKEAIGKAENATERRFEGVNEFRAQLDTQQRTFIPRSEVQVMESAAMNRIAAIEKQFDALAAERAGIKGGWGYAVGVIGFIFILVSLGLLVSRIGVH